MLTIERGQGNLARGPKQQQFEGVSGGSRGSWEGGGGVREAFGEFRGRLGGIPEWSWAVLGASWACCGAPGDVFGVLEVSAVSCWIKLSDQCGIVLDKIIEWLRAFRRR